VEFEIAGARRETIDDADAEARRTFTEERDEVSFRWRRLRNVG
jgi:hypothetical protein